MQSSHLNDANGEAEDAEDLEAIRAREREPSDSFDAFVSMLVKRGLLPAAG